MSKIEINLVYAPQIGPPGIAYENDKAIIWNCAERREGFHNIGMGWYSIRDPKPEDCLLVIEPFCILDIDYNPEFAKRFSKVFTWAVKAFPHDLNDKIVEINHPSCHTLPNPDTIEQNWKSWKERKNEIVFIANNKSSSHDSELYSLRINMADYLIEHSKMDVSWYGEIPLNKPYYKGRAESKFDILNNVKFSVCMENSYDKIYTHNYFTEKLPEVWFAGTVPIYMGCFNINNFRFPVDSYLDLRTYINKNGKDITKDYNSLISRVDNYTEDYYNNYRSESLKNMRNPRGVFYHISYKRMYEKIINNFI